MEAMSEQERYELGNLSHDLQLPLGILALAAIEAEADET